MQITLVEQRLNENEDLYTRLKGTDCETGFVEGMGGSGVGCNQPIP